MTDKPRASPGSRFSARPSDEAPGAGESDRAELGSLADLANAVVLSKTSEVVVIADLVDSVRLMQFDETGVIERWLGFLQQVQAELIPSHRGRVVRSTGDGMLLAFDSNASAVRAALGLHEVLCNANGHHPTKERLCLRIGIHAAQVFSGLGDIYGDGVNLAARLMTLAGPCETVVSEAVRDSLADGLDVTLEDLGECFMKNIAGPVRAYRVGPAGPAPVMRARSDYQPLLSPTIAVIPFEARQQETPMAIGELIADGVIACLSNDRSLRVISRLSTTPFRGRSATTAVELQAHLGATVVLTGSYGTLGGRVLIHFELCAVRDGQVLDAGTVTDRVDDRLQADSQIIAQIVARTHAAILREALERVQRQPLPSLESYSLLLGAIQLLHRSSTQGFAQSLRVLEFLIEKHPRAVEPRLWLAKWHTLRAVQDSQVDRAASASAALGCTRRALETDPSNAFALAMAGFVHCHLTHDYDAATDCLHQAIENNRSEMLGHLFLALTQGLMGKFEAGLTSFHEADSISPLDPDAFLVESIGAYLNLGANRAAEAAALALRSLRRNRLHAHSWRALTIAQVELGREDEARQSLAQVLKLQPGLSVASYLGAGRADCTRRRFAEALRKAGLPQG